jgi:hypothetical protein
MGLNYKLLAVLFFLFAIVLRVLLCWSNPVSNSFDNHFEPIFLIMKFGTIPAKNACWQCYHPPVFYWIFYGILTVGIIYLILSKLPLSDFSRLIAFGTVCFLPRHIYMSAMNSNDTISYLFVALSIYLLLIAIERKLSLLILLLASIVISITLFTKYSSYVVLPIILTSFVLLFYNGLIVPRKKVAASLILILLVPVALERNTTGSQPCSAS